MIQQWWLKSPRQLAVVLLILFSTVDALDFDQLCPKGNITVISANTNSIIVTPSRCFPTPVVHRNLLRSKPMVEIKTEPPKLFNYTAVMVEYNNTFNKYELYWLEPNLTVNAQQRLAQNTTFIRNIIKMIEYRPPKASPQNVTYYILVYRQSAMPVQPPPPGSGPFRPQSWATTSNLTLIGGATFKVLANVSFQPAHQPLPSPAVVPVSPILSPQHPQSLPGSGNVLQYNYSSAGNYSNHTRPAPLPPYYPPQPPSPYIPPAYQPPNQFHPPMNAPPQKGKKGAAVDLQAATSLIIVMALLSFVFNV
uniref:Putative secreted protein n=1 Tax=Panstrongylus lignarius TaxID=156445 RepID=A0A224XP24_9HEMI